MNKLENRKLDEIGKALVKAGSLPSRDVEKIVEAPALFDSIRARIGTDGVAPSPRRSYLRAGVTAFASLTVVAAAAFAVVVLTPEPATVAERFVPAPPANTELKSPEYSDSIADPVRDDDAITPQRVSIRPTVKTSRPGRLALQPASYGDDFYAVSYAGDPHETQRGGRIVRVDIPRSTLFAMGVDIPLENETETVKADLLIGSDGVTRAIRVVK